jgi:N-glycosylase/DNA lyase
MKNLHAMGIIKKIPSSLSKGIYLDIEKRMQEFSQAIKIPMSHLDLVLWYKETGEIFK